MLLNDKMDTGFYIGKRVAFINKAKSVKINTKFRAIWGKIVKSHGNNGLVRAQFAKNLPPELYISPQVLRDCENLYDDLAFLGEQAKIFTDIGTLTQRITKNNGWHYTEIMAALNTANTDATNGDYFGYGENIADGAFIALR